MNLDPYIAEYHDYSFDYLFDNIPYLPWIGVNYNKQSDKILIVPESVYDWKQGSESSKQSLSQKTFVRNCVREHGLQHTLPSDKKFKEGEISPLYRSTERLMWNEKQVANHKKQYLWTSVAFHEFVQRPMENKKSRPNWYDYVNGAKLLSSLIITLKPKVCIFLGSDTHKLNSLKHEFKITEMVGEKINRTTGKILKLDSIGINTTIVMVKHPSKYFSWSKWSQFLSKAAPEVMESFRAF